MRRTVAKRILLQGATGSIGRSTLEVVREQAGQFVVRGLAVRNNVQGALTLCEEFKPCSVAVEASISPEEEQRFRRSGVRELFTGPGAVKQQALQSEYDLLVNALTGGAGYEPTIAALERGIDVALANKETLVAAGPLVLELAARSSAKIIPIDSEHSAILQCLAGESRENIRRILLTSSGGPFWGREPSSLSRVSTAEALAHPTWKMGPKVTVDSATLFNKGLEVIEAARLFEVDASRIEVVIHRQSVVHSMVEFIDGSIKAQLGVPDMRLPILYALSYPDRRHSELVNTRVADLSHLTFEAVSPGMFPCLDLAFEALRRGGTAPAAISAADEVAVEAFLEGGIRFDRIATVVGNVLEMWEHEDLTGFDVLRRADATARDLARSCVSVLQEDGECASCC